MLGALIGDIAGSRFEWHNIKSKQFELFAKACKPTDDTVMSLAIARAILECHGTTVGLEEASVKWMQEFGRRYPSAGYGGSFRRWLKAADPKPYNSYGNGALRQQPA